VALRETAPAVRQRGLDAVRASWTGRGWIRASLISLAVGVFLAVAGAFGSAAMFLPLRVAYWSAGMLLGTVVARMVFGGLALLSPFRDNLPALRAVGTVAVAGVYTFGVWALTRAMAPPDYQPPLIGLFPVVLMIAAAMTALNILVERRRQEAAAGGTAPAPAPRFLDRLPLPLRGAELYALEAEDHYLRVRTSRGAELILCRLGDAVAELEGLEGLRTHRSWWVAKAAVAKVQRGDGRATLTLKDGTEAPVSRSAYPALKEKGWV
jgi:DNA-binding LytR/AlgR family response regulator